MVRIRRNAGVVGLLVCLSFCFALLSWGAGGGTANLVAGWNLLGNSSSGTLDVAATFGNSTQVTSVWKWVPSNNNWAFYTPLQADKGAAYALSKGYDSLSSVGAGEGFWVNAKTAFTAQLPAGTSLTSASFRMTLGAGWNLIAGGDNHTPSQFNQALSTAPPAFGTIPANMVTLWSWDAALANWYFYAPSLEASGGTALSNYVGSKGYLNFGTRTIDPATGFWVNRSAPPASIALSSADTTSAMPMSILTLSGSGFDTTATTYVRFADASQYSVDVRPIRVSSTSIAVTVPPYFNATTAVFTPGTVSLKVIQTSGAGTRTSGALAGIQILDLPNPTAPAGAVTLSFLQSLQANTTALQASVAGTALGSVLSSSLASQASALALLINTVQPVVSDPSARASLGTANGVSLNMGASELLQTDRLLLGTFQALGNGSSTLASVSGTAIAKGIAEPAARGALKSRLTEAVRRDAPVQLAFSGALDQLGIGALINSLLDKSQQGGAGDATRNAVIQLAQASTSGIPMQAEADAYTQCLLHIDAAGCNGGPMLRAPQETAPGRVPDATSTALTIVGASLVGAIAIGALIGTPVAATAGVLALSGYLAYATVFTGLAQIGIGASLGQTSDDARLLVEGGLKQLNDFVRDTTISIGVGAVAGDTAGLVNDVVTAGRGLGDILEQKLSPTTTSTSTSTTTTTTASTTTTTIGDAACFANYQTCIAKPACNPPTDLFTQSECVNACLGAYLACY